MYGESMRVTHLGHACVLVEAAGQRILIDPGNLSDLWHGQTDLNAVLVTHQHPDHCDLPQLATLLAANPQAQVFVEASIAQTTDDERLAPIVSGDTVTVGAITVTAVGGTHAEIHQDIPRIGNVGLVLAADGEPTFFHPGDSYATAPDGVHVVAVPAYGPWGAMKETIDFVRAVGAEHGFPIHDELLSDSGRALVFNRLNEMTSTSLVDLRGGKSQDY